MSDLELWLFVLAPMGLLAALGIGARRGTPFLIAPFRVEERRSRDGAAGEQWRGGRDQDDPTPEFFEMARALLLSQPASEIRDQIIAQIDVAVGAESRRRQARRLGVGRRSPRRR